MPPKPTVPSGYFPPWTEHSSQGMGSPRRQRRLAGRRPGGLPLLRPAVRPAGRGATAGAASISALRPTRRCSGRTPASRSIEVDPGPGFDAFSGEVHRIIEERGKEVFYVFDNLSALVVEWATDELLANFFQVTCPFLFELDTVDLLRADARQARAQRGRADSRHDPAADRRLPRERAGCISTRSRCGTATRRRCSCRTSSRAPAWSPVFQSGDAAAVSSVARDSPLRPAAELHRAVGERLSTG